jgi:hypothetical protein
MFINVPRGSFEMNEDELPEDISKRDMTTVMHMRNPDPFMKENLQTLGNMSRE